MSALAVAARHAALMEYAQKCCREATEMGEVVTTDGRDLGDDATDTIKELLTEALNAEAAAFRLRRESQGQGHQEDAA